MFLTAEEVQPAYSSGVLLLIAAAAVAVQLLLIMRFKLHAFVALVLVSFLTALATKVPFEKVVPTLLDGFGSTLANVALLVGARPRGKGMERSDLLEANGAIFTFGTPDTYPTILNQW